MPDIFDQAADAMSPGAVAQTTGAPPKPRAATPPLGGAPPARRGGIRVDYPKPNPNEATTDASGNPLSEEDLRKAAMQDPTAKAIADYLQRPPSLARGGTAKTILDRVRRIDPTYDEKEYNARNKVATDFAPSGASGKLLTGAEIALSHLSAVMQAKDALKSGNMRLLNAIGNRLGKELGQPAATTYDGIVSMVSPEISRLVIGATGGQEEREKMAQNFRADASPEQTRAQVKSMVGLVGTRLDAMASAYKSQMGRPIHRELNEHARNIMREFNVKAGGLEGEMAATNPGTAAPPLPQGGGKAIDEANGILFYNAAGGDPVKARKMAQEAGWKLQ